MLLVAIIDWASRLMLSCRLSNAKDSTFCLDALHEAQVYLKAYESTAEARETLNAYLEFFNCEQCALGKMPTQSADSQE